MNLIKNAVDHSGEPAPEIHVGVRETEDAHVFAIADDGVGIPPDQQEKIFEIFERGTRDGEGTGIGLAICERIVSRHGGDIWVESAEGAGTTVHFSIPKTVGQESTHFGRQVVPNGE